MNAIKLIAFSVLPLFFVSCAATDFAGITSREDRIAQANVDAETAKSELALIKEIEEALQTEADTLAKGEAPKPREVQVVTTEIQDLEVKRETIKDGTKKAVVVDNRLNVLRDELTNAAKNEATKRDRKTVLRELASASELRQELQVAYDSAAGRAKELGSQQSARQAKQEEAKVERQAERTATQALPGVLRGLAR